MHRALFKQIGQGVISIFSPQEKIVCVTSWPMTRNSSENGDMFWEKHDLQKHDLSENTERKISGLY